MRILMIVHGYPPECSGGTETYLPRLVQGLRENGHVVAVVTGSHLGRDKTTVVPYEHEGATVYKIHRQDLYVDHWGKSYAPDVENALDAIASEFQPDLIHVHHWIRLTRTLVAWSHGRGIPAVVTAHDLWTTCPIAFRVRGNTFCERPVSGESCHGCAPSHMEADEAENREALDGFAEDLRAELAMARRVLVATESHAREMRKHMDPNSVRFAVVPFGSLTQLKPTRPREDDSAGRIRFVHFGHLSYLKGADILLRAVMLLPERLKSRMRVDVFGAAVYPEERKALEHFAADAGVILRGAYTLEQLAKHQADVAIFPSRCSETHSAVLDEAFALGWPAIVPDRGALSERVGESGMRFQPEDPQSLAHAIGTCIENNAIITTWRSAIPKPYPFAKHVEDVLRVYHEVLADVSPLQRANPVHVRRRILLLARQVESRIRRLDFLRGDLRNAQDVIENQRKALADMDHYGREKEKVIKYLQGRLDEPKA